MRCMHLMINIKSIPNCRKCRTRTFDEFKISILSVFRFVSLMFSKATFRNWNCNSNELSASPGLLQRRNLTVYANEEKNNVLKLKYFLKYSSAKNQHCFLIRISFSSWRFLIPPIPAPGCVLLPTREIPDDEMILFVLNRIQLGVFVVATVLARDNKCLTMTKKLNIWTNSMVT